MEFINDVKAVTNSHDHPEASVTWSQGSMCCADLTIQEDCSYSNGIIYNQSNSSQS